MGECGLLMRERYLGLYQNPFLNFHHPHPCKTPNGSHTHTRKSTTPIRPARTQLHFRLVDPGQVAQVQQDGNVARGADPELGAQPRLAEPGRNGSAFDVQRLDDFVHVVAVRIVGRSRVAVEAGGREGALRERGVGG